jgi:hypothetical protein
MLEFLSNKSKLKYQGREKDMKLSKMVKDTLFYTVFMVLLNVVLLSIPATHRFGLSWWAIGLAVVIYTVFRLPRAK